MTWCDHLIVHMEGDMFTLFIPGQLRLRLLLLPLSAAASAAGYAGYASYASLVPLTRRNLGWTLVTCCNLQRVNWTLSSPRLPNLSQAWLVLCV